jgi:gamma-tubulin complex component 2
MVGGGGGGGGGDDDYHHYRQDYGPPNTVRVNSTPPRNSESRNNNINNSGRHSPGVERLSSFLMDSSSVNDISTIADMTQHQMESSPSFERRYPSSPLLRERNANNHNANNHYSSPSSFQRGISPRRQQQPQEQEPTYHHNQHHDNQNKEVHRDGNHDDIDDQGTVDDGKLLTMDSACLKTGLTIMLRAYCNNSTIVGIDEQKHKERDENECLAEALGLCLGRDEELLEVRKVFATANDSEDLRHGDTVVFFSMATEGCSLGVQTDSNRHSLVAGSSRMRLGFFPSESTVSDTWMILSARPDREVLVGRAAVASKTPPTGKSIPPPVRSGDHVLIRNCYNGGILSIDSQGHLILLTDSYGSRNNFNKMQEDPTLMGRLQNHDRLYPSPRETFQLLLSSTPPCPQWITGRSMDERVFLTGSYILQPRRNQRSAEFETNLFSGAHSQGSSALSYMERHTPSDANLSAQVKEKILIDEVIGSFLGLESRHIRLKGTKGHTSSLDNYDFQLFGADGVSFDVSLTHLVEQILPLSTSYVRVRNFISSHNPGYEYGRVMHAFCEGLDFLLQDYVNFVNQLERQHRKYSRSDPLTMKNIYYQITPSLHSMSIMEHATKAVCEKKGGDLINSLWALDKRSYMGDTVAKKVLGILLDRASVPYMEMMSSWLQTGLLKDPYEEFMIRRPSDSKQKTSKLIELDGDAWMALFEIDEIHVLKDVITNDWTKKKILTTGRYWNAVNACSVDQESYQEKSQGAYKIPKLEFNSDSSAISAYIDNMYQNASRVLVRLMMHNFRLMDSLRIMRRYFLLDKGDFLVHFLDASEQELVKQAENVSIGRVQHCLSMAVQLTEGYREDVDSEADVPSLCLIDPKRLRCRFSAQSLVAHLDSLYGGIADMEPQTPSRQVYGMSSKGNTGIEVFQIEFPRIPFPISLALSQHAMDNYKLLFRHLFFTKHVERRLIGVWRDHQVLKKLDSVRGLLGPTFLLRQRMLHFVQNLIYYMSFEVIESNWIEMISSIDLSTDPMAPQSQRHHTVDDILNVHDEFLKKTLGACLLSNKGLIRSLTKLLNTCLLFTDQMRRFMDTTKIVGCTCLVF